MTIKKTFLLFLAFTLILACKQNNPKTKTKNYQDSLNTSKDIEQTKADHILKKTIDAHGGDLYNSAEYALQFRGNKYKFKNKGHNYEYKKHILKNDTLTEDILKNGQFSRFINSKPVVLTAKDISKYTEALNSVIYFSTIPHKLNDKAVNVSYIEKTSIKGEFYDVLGITFNKESGGTDYDDEFHYWVNKSSNKIDYLAYNYKVNNGGVRFRSAYNRRVIDGITFQDYINYKAEIGTPLKDLPVLFEAGKLKELSRIETEDIINLNKQQK